MKLTPTLIIAAMLSLTALMPIPMATSDPNNVDCQNVFTNARNNLNMQLYDNAIEDIAILNNFCSETPYTAESLLAMYSGIIWIPDATEWVECKNTDGEATFWEPKFVTSGDMYAFWVLLEVLGSDIRVGFDNQHNTKYTATTIELTGGYQFQDWTGMPQITGPCGKLFHGSGTHINPHFYDLWIYFSGIEETIEQAQGETVSTSAWVEVGHEIEVSASVNGGAGGSYTGSLSYGASIGAQWEASSSVTWTATNVYGTEEFANSGITGTTHCYGYVEMCILVT